MAETTEESLANFQQTTETDWHKSDFQVLHFQQNLTLMAEWAYLRNHPQQLPNYNHLPFSTPTHVTFKIIDAANPPVVR